VYPGFAATFPESLNLLVLDNGAGHKAKAVRWPSNVLPIFLSPYRTYGREAAM
jgi:hypothetical protein